MSECLKFCDDGVNKATRTVKCTINVEVGQKRVHEG